MDSHLQNMSVTKKRKSDVHLDHCAYENGEQNQSKKEKPWFEETDDPLLHHASAKGSNRRKSFFGFSGILSKMKSSSTLKDSNKMASTSKLEKISINDTQLSESSMTSVDSANLPNVGKNAGLKSFVGTINPIPNVDDIEDKNAESIDDLSQKLSDGELSRIDDKTSLSSQMSIDGTGSIHTLDDSASFNIPSSFCTPVRTSIHRNTISRISTRSVPGSNKNDDFEFKAPTLASSLCNSVVRRAPPIRSDGSLTPNGGFARRSIRMDMQRKHMTTTSMEDVPEEEVLTVSSSLPRIPNLDDEKFTDGREYFTNNVTSMEDCTQNDDDCISTATIRLSMPIENRKLSVSNSIENFHGRRSSIFKMFKPKERRNSEAYDESYGFAPNRSAAPASNDGNLESFAGVSTSATSLASNGSHKPVKLRKKTPSTSNLTQRISAVFRRSTNNVGRDDEVPSMSNRRNTLTGYSSTSSGIGSIASIASDMDGRNGTSVSRQGSKREDDSRREKIRKMLDNVIVSDIPADELIRLKIEQLEKREQKEMNEKYETQLVSNAETTNNEHNGLQNESGSSTSSNLVELLSFDVVAVDVKPNGAPSSETARAIIDEKMELKIKEEIRNTFRQDHCGTIADNIPIIVFSCAESSHQKSMHDSMLSADGNQDLLRNVRCGLLKAIDFWKTVTAKEETSTILVYPMFCASDADWDATETIDALFCMLEGILGTGKKWRINGKCILAGITPNNCRLIREKYEEIKLSVAIREPESHDGMSIDGDSVSINSTSTCFARI